MSIDCILDIIIVIYMSMCEYNMYTVDARLVMSEYVFICWLQIGNNLTSNF